MKKHLFLIDHDEADVAVFLNALNHIGMPYKCTWAKSGEQALKQLKYLAPDIIFVDVSLPDMNGMKCLAGIREATHLRQLPIVLHSTCFTAEDREKGKNIGATAYLEKPDTIPALAEILNELIPPTPTE